MAHQTARVSTLLGIENQELVEQKSDLLSQQVGLLFVMLVANSKTKLILKESSQYSEREDRIGHQDLYEDDP